MKKLLIFLLFTQVLFGQTWEKIYYEWFELFGNLNADALCQTEDEILLCGHGKLRKDNVYLANFSKKDGEMKWIKEISAPDREDFPRAMLATEKNIFIVGIANEPKDNCWLVKTDLAGQVMQKRIWIPSPTENFNGILEYIFQYSDSSLMAIGSVTPFVQPSEDDYYQRYWIEFDENLNTIRQGYFPNYIQAMDKEEKSFIGYSYKWGTNGPWSFSVKIHKLDKDMNLIWEKTYPQEMVGDLRPGRIVNTKNYYVILGISDKNEYCNQPLFVEIEKESGEIAFIRRLSSKLSTGYRFIESCFLFQSYYQSKDYICFFRAGQDTYITGSAIVTGIKQDSIVWEREYSVSKLWHAELLDDNRYCLITNVNDVGLKILVDSLPLASLIIDTFKPKPSVMEKFILKQNYPNPFNQSTCIQYHLPQNSKVEITIYDLNGQIVENFLLGWQTAGEHNFYWQPKNISNGVYFYKVNDVCKKMTIIK